MNRRTIARAGTFLVPLLTLFIGIGALPRGADAASYGSAEAGFWSEVSPVRQARPAHRVSGTRHHRLQTAPSRTEQTETQPSRTRQALRTPVRIPRGSGGYVAPVALPTTGPISTGPVVQPYNPPPTTTFSDRVNSAIQAFPLERGIGNNPVNQQEFIRQRANGVP